MNFYSFISVLSLLYLSWKSLLSRYPLTDYERQDCYESPSVVHLVTNNFGNKEDVNGLLER